MQVLCDEMCGFDASKCADVVRQNVVGLVQRNVRVLCVKMCAYAAKCRNGATEGENGETERCHGKTEWRRNGDRDLRQIDKIELYLRTVVIFIAFQLVTLICTIKTEIECKS